MSAKKWIIRKSFTRLMFDERVLPKGSSAVSPRANSFLAHAKSPLSEIERESGKKSERAQRREKIKIKKMGSVYESENRETRGPVRKFENFSSRRTRAVRSRCPSLPRECTSAWLQEKLIYKGAFVRKRQPFGNLLVSSSEKERERKRERKGGMEGGRVIYEGETRTLSARKPCN